MRELQEQHITKDIFNDWQQGKLNGAQEEAFLKHAGTCTFCAEKFGNWMEESMLIEPPAYLKEEISRRTRQLDVQTAVKVKQTSKQMQLLMYSLRVSLAVAASIFLLTVTANVQKMNIELPERQTDKVEEHEEKEELTSKLKRGSNYITDSLNQMINGLFEIERGSIKE